MEKYAICLYLVKEVLHCAIEQLTGAKIYSKAFVRYTKNERDIMLRRAISYCVSKKWLFEVYDLTNDEDEKKYHDEFLSQGVVVDDTTDTVLI